MAEVEKSTTTTILFRFPANHWTYGCKFNIKTYVTHSKLCAFGCIEPMFIIAK